MMGGCVKNMFALFGCGTIVVAGGVLAWVYQDPILDAYHAFAGDLRGAESVEIEGPGRPTADWRRSARRKQDAMARFLGPESVSLNSAEVAALVLDGLDPVAEGALDSVQVTLEPDRFILEAQLLTDVWGKDALGPFGGILEPRETLRVGGEATVVGAGIIAWTPDELRIRDIPFPVPAIRLLINSLTGRSDGALLLAAPVTIRDMEILTDQVTFYRRVR